MGLIQLLKKVRDLGVPSGMSPEEAKHIQMLNVVTGLFVVMGISFSLWFLLNRIRAAGPASPVVQGVELGYTVLICGVFIGNWRLCATKARFYFTLIGTLAIIALMVIEGCEVMNHYWFLVAFPLLFVIFPWSEWRLMWSLVVVNIVLFAASDLVYHHLGPFAHYNPAETRSVRGVALVGMFISVLVSLTVSGYFTHRAEVHLREANNKITSLSAKLKVYLPRQFVEALANGGRETPPDYCRKRLTIFFSDIEGFTEWTDKLQPEEVRDIINNYLSEMSKIASRWDGTIDKFIGDCLMIFFGDPVFTNDKNHAVRCVKMAMEMQEKMTELRDGWRKMAYDEPLKIRIGINTGWATVGNFGSEDRLNYTALGSAVNLASRIESACTADKITVSHTTFLLIEDEIECESKGVTKVKGFAAPVKIYEVAGMKSSP